MFVLARGWGALLSLFLVVSGCAGHDAEGRPSRAVPARYAFTSRLDGSASSVSYSGQTLRQVLIEDLDGFIASITESIDRETWQPADEGEVVRALNTFFRFDSNENGDDAIRLETPPSSPGVLQVEYNDIAVDKNLIEKLAGNDPATDHKDWATEFVGWEDTSIAAYGGSVSSPTGLIEAFFETIEHNALGRVEGTVLEGPEGEALPVHVTEAGLDLRQLVEKFLHVALAFHQAADDYLDSDVEGKGLRSDNSEPVEGRPYTTLEHAWDEAFGYFGAARDYGEYEAEEIARRGGRDAYKDGVHDTDGDGHIDLESEFNFGASTNAAKRDLGSRNLDPTSFAADAFLAFRTGRTVISEGAASLSDEDVQELERQRNAALFAWEAAIAATVVHYINETLHQMAAFGTEGYDFPEHAKVWSEMKGFALAFQFNPRSPMAESDFIRIHSQIGDAPVLADADEETVMAYQLALLDVRAILQTVFGFDDANLGDIHGENGW